MGFTTRQAQIALKRTKFVFLFSTKNKRNEFYLNRNDLHAAMDFLLTNVESIEDENEQIVEEEEQEVQQQQQQPNVETIETLPLFSRQGPFVSFRQYRQQKFQPNQRAIQSLKDMGFNHDDIVEALRKFHNDQNLAVRIERR